MRTIIKEASFAGSFASLPAKLHPPLPEVAVIGRSNVGKSSFINRSLKRRNLARTSSTPGRTQSLVYFKVGVMHPRQARKDLYLVDLPGFGFAKLAKKERERLHKLVADYLLSNPRLRLICLLNDARREPAEEEFLIRDLALQTEAPLLIGFTKTDKLTKSEASRQIPHLASLYGLEPSDVIVTGTAVESDPFWDRVTLVL